MISKCVIKVEDYPNGSKIIPLNYGDILFISAKNAKILDKYPLKIILTYHKPRKWYKIWKKKEPMGYLVIWVGEDENVQEN